MDLPLLIALAFSLAALALYYAHLVPIAAGWMIRRAGERLQPAGSETFISVVVAARNESRRIVALLECLEKQDYPSDRMEVIIVDDHSRDRTYKLTEKFIRERGLKNFRIISLKVLRLQGTKKNAIRYGVLDAGGELVVVTDADCLPGPQWLKAYSREYRATGAAMLFGPVLLKPMKGFAGAFQELEFLSLVGSGAGAARIGRPVFCNGANMAFRRAAFSEVGGYKGNERYASGDDVFLLHKFKKRFGSKSVRFLADREAILFTGGMENWKDFIGQRIRWASKTRGYGDLFTFTLAVSVFFMNLALALILVAGILKPAILLIFGGLFAMKMLPDLWILAAITGFAGRRKLLRWFPVFEAVYIAYVIYAGIMSQFARVTWKGRKTIRKQRTSTVTSRDTTENKETGMDG